MCSPAPSWRSSTRRSSASTGPTRRACRPAIPTAAGGRMRVGAHLRKVTGVGASGSQGDSGRSDPRVPSDATSDNYYTPGAQLAQNNWSSGTLIDLRAEDERGGHSIANHVGKSEAYLLNVVHQQALSTTRRGELAEGLREGSFPSLESANKLVSSTLSQNPDKVAAVAAGFSPREQADALFDRPTGIEAYAANERSRAYIRETNGVRVVIVPDRTSSRGYRVDTAFPINIGR